MARPAEQARFRARNGDQLELAVDAFAHGGNGIARVEGYVVFVAGAVPGDRVRAVVTKGKRDYAEARTVEILEPSPQRVPPVADHPGAPWQVLPYELQVEEKARQVDDALRRIGKLDGFELEPLVPAVEHWRYRNKVEFSFGAGADGALVCGFHAPGRWEQIDPVDDCLLVSERINRVREQVTAYLAATGLDPWDRRTGLGVLRNLVIRESRRGGQVTARIVTADGVDLDGPALKAAVPDADGLLQTRTDQPGETTAGGETHVLAGHPDVTEEVLGMQFRISPQAFFQTNTEMAEQLYGIARDYAALSGYERVFDLYCGIGTIGLVLAPMAAELHGLELVADAARDASRNAHLNQIEHAHFHAGDVRLHLRQLTEEAGKPNVIVVDPPRSGLSQKIVRRVIEAAPERIVYVSCNPTTLAPNAAQLVEAGYRLVRVRPVDMFPQTPHIECVALLERDG